MQPDNPAVSCCGEVDAYEADTSRSRVTIMWPSSRTGRASAFNVPDLRGGRTFGQDNMGGAATNRITFAGVDSTVTGNSGGRRNQTPPSDRAAPIPS
jgi:hypothetical protein